MWSLFHTEEKTKESMNTVFFLVTNQKDFAMYYARCQFPLGGTESQIIV